MRVNGQALRAIRERSGYSIRGLAAESGIAKSTISAIEQGDRPVPLPATIRALAGALLVPTTALLDSSVENVE